MTGIPLASAPPSERASVSRSTLAALVLSLATALSVAGIAFAIWITPPLYFDGALDRSGSPTLLGLPPETVHAVSASVVGELFFGSGAFAQTIPGPDGQPVAFFGPAEASHLRDVQVWVRLLSVGILAALAIVVVTYVRAGRTAWFWQGMARGARGLALGLGAVGLLFLVAFEPAFTLFHLIFFPEGNWSFDLRTARMVQLYNPDFWQEAVIAYAVLAIALAIVAWLAARALASRAEAA